MDTNMDTSGMVLEGQEAPSIKFEIQKFMNAMAEKKNPCFVCVYDQRSKKMVYNAIMPEEVGIASEEAPKILEYIRSSLDFDRTDYVLNAGNFADA